MQSKSSQHQSGELFRPRLDEQINLRHPLVKKLDGSVHFNDLAHILFDQALQAATAMSEKPEVSTSERY